MSKQEKLLLVGGDIATPHAIKYCKSIGVYTIMTNDIPYENNPYKQMADEAWEIPVEELDILEEKCREVGVTAVFAGVNEHNLDMTKALADRLGLPFYASDEGWRCSRDKLYFKEQCISVGLDVPHQYPVQKPFTEEMLAAVSYPVIVKPVDSSGSRGITVCCSSEELPAAFDNALSFSETKSVVVEDYFDGDEFMLFACLQNGVPVIYGFGISCRIPVNGRLVTVYSSPSPMNRIRFEEKYGQKLAQLFAKMECRHGVLFMQGAVKDGRYYLYEVGYRLDGMAGWLQMPDIIGFNPLELQVDIALGHSEERHLLTDAYKNSAEVISVYQIYAKAGKISKIVGLQDILEQKNIRVTINRYKEGDQVQFGSTMFHLAYALVINSKSEQEAKEILQFIEKTLHVYDENGQDMLYYFDNYSVFESEETVSSK